MKKYKRLIVPPQTSFFLFGMRGVGKSTWAKEQYADAKYINLLSESLYQEYLVRPQSFVEELSTAKAGSWVVVDEMQRLPNLLNEIHRHIEERKIKFVLLGSSARKLRSAGVNLLGGRALKKVLSPFLPEELGRDFSLNEVLRFGSLPLIWNAENKTQQLEAYLQLYLKEEIQAEALVRNLPGFARFIQVAAIFHGQVINVEGIARDCGVARSTVEGYLQILEDTLLTFRLPPYPGKLRVKQRKHPKLYWLDSGIVRAAKRQLQQVTQEEKGFLFEGFIGQLLKSYHEQSLLDYDELYYWSAGKNSVEVDFVIQRAQKLIAVEVKSGEQPRSDWFSGIDALSESGKVERKILVYLGKRKFISESGVEVFPLEEFIELLKERNL